MSDIIIYHNGRCSKSRGALEILQEKEVPFEVRWYLTEPLNQKELKALLKKLGMKAAELVRKSEPLYKEQYKDQQLSEQQWIKILAENPVLIERPIVEKGDKAIVARPPEKVLSFL
ncbi:MAG: arsenate reductase (glutaredoxin) [Bacteroidetes bacterium]|nr:arsenate reductase (glutaredoxin) [Bacteroidota bacterium]